MARHNSAINAIEPTLVTVIGNISDRKFVKIYSAKPLPPGVGETIIGTHIVTCRAKTNKWSEIEKNAIKITPPTINLEHQESDVAKNAFNQKTFGKLRNSLDDITMSSAAFAAPTFQRRSTFHEKTFIKTHFNPLGLKNNPYAKAAVKSNFTP